MLANTNVPSAALVATKGAVAPARTGRSSTVALAIGSLVPQRPTRPCSDDGAGCATASDTLATHTDVAMNITLRVIGPPAHSARARRSWLRAGARTVRGLRTRV